MPLWTVVAGIEDFGELIGGARQGEEWALTALYRRYNTSLVRFLAGLVPGEAEDLAADTWIDVARAIRGFEGDESALRGLLFTVARRRAIDLQRRHHRRRTDPVDMEAQVVTDNGPDVSQMVADGDASARAVSHIRALLSPEQAEIVLLRVVAGLSVAEVADIVGRRPAAVSVLQTRALHRLASKLGDPSRWERTSKPQ